MPMREQIILCFPECFFHSAVECGEGLVGTEKQKGTSELSLVIDSTLLLAHTCVRVCVCVFLAGLAVHQIITITVSLIMVIAALITTLVLKNW